jgi:hypothetical protein
MVKAKLMEKAKELILVGLFEGGVFLYKKNFSVKTIKYRIVKLETKPKNAVKINKYITH